MARVSIRYLNGTTVEANNLGDALFHIAHTGADYVTDVIEEHVIQHCEHCGGTGIAADQPEPVVLLDGDEVKAKVAEINEATPLGPESNIDDRVKAARQVAKA